MRPLKWTAGRCVPGCRGGVVRTDGYAFPLARYLENVVAIHAHCTVLTKHANSPRLRRHFHYKLSEIRGFPAIITAVPSPTDSGKLIEDTRERHKPETADDTRLRQIGIVTQQKAFRSDDSVQAPVHCECCYCLVAPLRPAPAAPRVGTLVLQQPNGGLGRDTSDKLSCNACARFIEASNEYGNPKFYTRGRHGKQDFSWALPPSNQQVSSTFYESMARYIVELSVWKAAAGPRSNSDSSCASADLEGVPDENETDGTNRVLAREFESVFGRS